MAEATEQRARLPEKLAFFLTEKWRYKIAKGGRGSAKSRTISASLVIRGAQRPERWLCARETQKSLKYSSKQILEDEINRLGLQGSYEVLADEIRGTDFDADGRRTLFIFAGLKETSVDSLKSLEDFDGCWLAEGHHVSKASWEKLTPTFRKPGAEIWVDYNPELEDDFIHKFALKPPPNAKVVHVNYDDNPWFPEDLRVDMEHMKRTDPASYRHVWLGVPKSSADGAIFAAEMAQVDADGRICSVPVDLTKPVDVVCDMGFGDLFSMWFVQGYGGYLNFVGFYENNQQHMSHYVMVAQQRAMEGKFVLGRFILPHDSTNNITHKRLAGASDLSTSIPDTLKDLGMNVRLSPALLKEDKRSRARAVFPICRFDASNCADGITHMRYYRWNKEIVDGKREEGKWEPKHDEHSHAADSFMEACTSVKPLKTAPDIEPKRPAVQMPVGPQGWMAGL